MVSPVILYCAVVFLLSLSTKNDLVERERDRERMVWNGMAWYGMVLRMVWKELLKKNKELTDENVILIKTHRGSESIVNASIDLSYCEICLTLTP